MKNTDTRLASRMSSIWALPERAFAGVKRLVLTLRIRCASSRTTTSSGSLTFAVSRKYLNNAPARAPTILRRFSVKAFEPVTWRVLSPRSASSATRFTAMTDLPVPGPPSTRKTTDRLVLPGAADLVDDRVVGHQLLVEERERRFVANDAGDMVEQPLVGLERGRRYPLEDRSVVRATDPLVEEGREGVDARRRRTRGSSQGAAAKLGVVERRQWVVLRVVEVGACVEGDRTVGEGWMGVDQVALVLGDLARRVQVVDDAAAEVDRHAVGDVRPTDLRPLLELHDDRRVAGGRVLARDEDVQASRGERQLELDEDSLVGQVRQLKHRRHGAERVAPRRDLGRRRPVPELLEEPIGKLVGEPSLGRITDELLGGALVEVHRSGSPSHSLVDTRFSKA